MGLWHPFRLSHDYPDPVLLTKLRFFLTDDNLVGLADDLFQALDAEESHGANTGAK